MPDLKTLTGLDRTCIGAAVLIMVGGAAVALFGPAGDLPIHYGHDGAADGWVSREALGAIILGLGGLLLVLCGGMGRAARASQEESRRRGLRANQLITLVTLSALTVFAASTSLARLDSIAQALPMAGLSALFIAIGALLGRAAPNPFVGVRTPWTYKSRIAWDRSNRLAGRLFCLIGLCGLAASPVAPQPAALVVLIAAVVAAAAWAVVESWRVWRADPDRQPF